jgi:hypothetical protein
MACADRGRRVISAPRLSTERENLNRRWVSTYSAGRRDPIAILIAAVRVGRLVERDAFAAVLYKVVRSPAVASALSSIVQSALHAI